jgi:dihydroorotate dehydrogenase electron transfer subunit
MRYQLDVPILAHERIADCEYEMTLLSPEIANCARPGQFLQILYDMTYNPFTRRPFSVYRVDREKGTFSIVYLARGVFTQGLRNKQVGQNLSVVGPLGNWFTPPDSPDATLILVGGGVGAPPIYFFASELSAEGRADRTVVVINGARSESLLVGVREFSELDIEMHFVTDDGSFGARGVVTDVLLERLERQDGPVQVYACGPTGMLRAVSNLCIARDVPCQVSVETPMPCGLGVCMGCVVKIKDAASPDGFTYQRSCYEGPVFRADEILWE